MDRSLACRRYLESLRKKLTSSVPLLKRLPGSGWGAGATTLRIATLSMGHSTLSSSTAWCRSAHARLINPAINDALRIVTGCLHPTPADNLPVLAGIQPAELRRKRATLSLARHGSRTPAPLSAHLSIECRCRASQIETPICNRCTTTHQFI